MKIDGLARVNLLVGKNNSGKSSVLEAVNLLARGGHPLAVWQPSYRRGEAVYDERGVDAPRLRRTEIEVSHLFTGHKLEPSVFFEISGRIVSGARYVRYTVEKAGGEVEETDTVQLDLGMIERVFGQKGRLALNMKSDTMSASVPLSRFGGFGLREMESLDIKQTIPVVMVSTDSLSVPYLVESWGDIQLRPPEVLVLKALQFLDNSIEKIQPKTSSLPRSSGAVRGGFEIKLKDAELPVPIGSMGEGMWRVLALVVALAQSSN